MIRMELTEQVSAIQSDFSGGENQRYKYSQAK